MTKVKQSVLAALEALAAPLCNSSMHQKTTCTPQIYWEKNQDGVIATKSIIKNTQPERRWKKKRGTKNKWVKKKTGSQMDFSTAPSVITLAVNRVSNSIKKESPRRHNRVRYLPPVDMYFKYKGMDGSEVG